MKILPPSKPNALDAVDKTVTTGAPPLHSPGAPPLHPPEFARGTKVGRHTILDRVGQGGMGLVYTAYDSDLDRKIALKFLHPERAFSPMRKMRLLREAQAMARLSHPNVVAVHDVGTFEGQIFLAMEFVEGVDLRRWLAETPRGTTQILGIFHAAGRGLAAAHAAGIIHRDFKPENVLVDKQNRPRITDFGLARTSSSSNDEDEAPQSERGAAPASPSLLAAPLTRTGEVHGTLPYMSPEHHLGEPTDARSDQFSFCVTLYEAVFGERPFRGGDVDELVGNLLLGEVQPPPAQSSVPRWCRKALLRGLRTEPEERFPSMDALLTALDWPSRAKRRRIGVAAAGILGAAFIAGGLVFGDVPEEERCTGGQAQLAEVWNPTNAAGIQASFAATGRPHARSSAERVAKQLDTYARKWSAMHRATCQATARGEQSADLLDRRMACLGRRLGQAEAVVELFVRRADGNVVDKAIEIAAGLEPLSRCADAAALLEVMALPADPAKRARVEDLQRQVDRAEAEREAGRYQIATDSAQAVIVAEREIDYAPIAGQAERVRGRSFDSLGRFPEAREALLRALSLAERAGDSRLAGLVLCHLLDVIGDSQERHGEARLLGRVAEALLEHPALRGDLELRGQLLLALAALAMSEKYIDRAVELRREALALRRRSLAPDDPLVAAAEWALGSSLAAKSSNEEARSHLHKALGIWRRALGERHPNLASTHNTLARTYHAEGQLLESRKHLQAAIAILGPVGRYRLYPHLVDNLGIVENSLGNLEAARAHHEAALALRVEMLGPEHPNVATSLHNLAYVLRNTPDLERAHDLERRALAIWEKAVGKEHPNYAVALASIGEDFRRLGRPSVSLEHQERAQKIFQARATGTHEHEYLDKSLTYRGLALADLGRRREAVPILERALALLGPIEPNRARVAFALAKALEPGGPRSQRAVALSLEALTSFAHLRAKREIGQVTAYLARGKPRPAALSKRDGAPL